MILVIFFRQFRTKSPTKYSKSITALAACLLLAACAGPRLTAEDVAIAQYQAEAARACYAAQALPAYADARDAALIAMARALTGDPCKQTNVYDSRAAIAAAQNQALGAAVSGAVIGAGIVAGADVLKTALRQTGNTTNTNITGTGNGAAHYDTRANVDNRISTRGDNAPASASTPASGPDLSTPTTHLTVEARP